MFNSSNFLSLYFLLLNLDSMRWRKKKKENQPHISAALISKYRHRPEKNHIGRPLCVTLGKWSAKGGHSLLELTTTRILNLDFPPITAQPDGEFFDLQIRLILVLNLNCNLNLGLLVCVLSPLWAHAQKTYLRTVQFLFHTFKNINKSNQL